MYTCLLSLGGNVINKHEKSSILDVVFYSMMVGLSENFFGTYILALGISEQMTGLLAVVPIVVGSTLLLLLQHFQLYKQTASTKIILVGLGILQASGLFIFLIPSLFIFSQQQTLAIIWCGITMFWVAFQISNSLWTAWIGKIIRGKRYTAFFSKRNALSNLFILASVLLAGGVIETWKDKVSSILYIYAVLFFVACLLRLISAFFIAVQDEQSPQPILMSSITAKKQAQVDLKGIWWPLVFSFLSNASIQFSFPFYTPYIISERHFSYWIFTVLICGFFFARFFGSYVGKFITAKFGYLSLLMLEIILLVPISYFFGQVEAPWAFFLMYFGTGMAFAFHDLGIVLLILDRFHLRETFLVMSRLHFINGLGMLFGALLGASLVGDPPVGRETYQTVFNLSALLRILPIFCLLPLAFHKKKQTAS